MFSGRAIKKGLFCGFTKHRAVVGVLYASLAPPGLWNWRMSEINDSYEKSLFWKSLYLKEEFLPFQTFSGHRKSLQEIMVLISDGNLDHVAHVKRKLQVFPDNKNLYMWLFSIYSNALNKSNNKYCSLRAHLFLSYHLIWAPREKCSPAGKLGNLSNKKWSSILSEIFT